MATFEDILKSIQQQENIEKSLVMNSQLYKLKKIEAQMMKSSSLALLITERIKEQKLFTDSTLSAIDTAAKYIDFQTKFLIPKKTLDTISSISNQQEKLFKDLKTVADTFNKNQTIFSQISNWQFAINSFSGQLAELAASQLKWNIIDDFEEITEEAVSLNERIFDENGLTKNGLNELKDFFQRIEIKIDKIDGDANAIFWKLLAVLSFILTIIGEARNWSPKPEYATKQEVEAIIKEQFALYKMRLNEHKEFRLTNRKCNVIAKPRLRSLIIDKLPVNFEVNILQTKHKWVYVSYLNPIDDLPHTGWILKKYLSKSD